MGLAQSVRHRPVASGAALAVRPRRRLRRGGDRRPGHRHRNRQLVPDHREALGGTRPSAVVGPVWTVLYVAMAVAAWLVAREGLTGER